MSAEATFWAWMMGVKPSTAKLTLVLLADCHNGETGRCDPSTKFIAEFTGLDKKTVPEAIDTLQAQGLLRKIKRPGRNTQYDLLIAENPVPARDKKAPRRTVPIARPEQMRLTRNRVHPKSGTPEIGATDIGGGGSPDIGGGVDPISGHEPISNLPIEPTSADRDESRSGADAPGLVDNSLAGVDRLYSSENPERDIVAAAVTFFGERGHSERSARGFIGKVLAEHGEQRTLDALAKALIYEPVDPTAWLSEVLDRAARETRIPFDWEPPGAWVENAIQGAEKGGLGLPLEIIQEARDVFVLWFHETGIAHHDWLDMFRRWCVKDWERAQRNRADYRYRLARSAGLLPAEASA